MVEKHGFFASKGNKPRTEERGPGLSTTGFSGAGHRSSINIRENPEDGRPMTQDNFAIQPIGIVRSELKSLEAAPRQGDEGAPEAWLEVAAHAADGLLGIRTGDELIVLTWLHRAQRDVLQVHPRGMIERPLRGVFATR